MNYRHGFHAGNHADVLKHVGLAILMAGLKGQVDFLDTHAGRGLYDLAAPEALRAGEFRHGISRVMMAKDQPEALAPYMRAVSAANPGGALLTYPGSPLIVAQFLSKSSRLMACELDKGEAALLKAALKRWPQARAEAQNGYAKLAAFQPSKGAMPVILMDPPFERADEFTVMAEALSGALKRLPQAAGLAWYPLKDRAAADGFLASVTQARPTHAMAFELMVRAPAKSVGMAGSGLLAINTPSLAAPMQAVLPWLSRVLAQGDGASSRLVRLVPDTPPS
jgi:23S rRNA (adenine2030-N6)-methyltransferase